MKTKLQIIQETKVAYSDPSNRAIGKDSYCAYKTESGKKCAVGQFLLDGCIKKVWEHKATASDLFDTFGQNILKKEYIGYATYFWNDLQRLHDNSENFTEIGWSVKGLERISALEEKYSD